MKQPSVVARFYCWEPRVMVGGFLLAVMGDVITSNALLPFMTTRQVLPSGKLSIAKQVALPMLDLL